MPGQAPSVVNGHFSEKFEAEFSEMIGKNNGACDICLCEVLDSLVAGSVSTEVVCDLLRKGKEAAASDEENDYERCLVASLSCFCFITSENDSEGYGRLCSLISTIAKDDIVSAGFLNIRLELQTLIDSDILGSSDQKGEDMARYKNRLTKINTNLVYRQQKYNLYRHLDGPIFRLHKPLKETICRRPCHLVDGH